MEQKIRKFSPLGIIAFIIMFCGTLCVLVFYGFDAVAVLRHNRYFDGWRYFLPIAVHLLLFSISALLYFFKRRWKQLLYTSLLGVLIATGSVFFPIAVWSTVLCILILMLLTVFRKQFLY